MIPMTEERLQAIEARCERVPQVLAQQIEDALYRDVMRAHRTQSSSPFDGYTLDMAKLFAAARTDLPDAIAEIRALRAALKEIVNPIKTLRERAEAEGNRLNSMAYSICNDPNYLQNIARAALEPKP